MNLFSRSRSSLVCSWVCGLCLFLGPASAARAASAMPASTRSATICAASQPHANLVFAGFFDNILGNRTRMIQTAVVAVAVGIFILTRK